MTWFEFIGDDQEYIAASAKPDGWVDIHIHRYKGLSEICSFSFQPGELDKLLEVLLKARLEVQEIVDGLD